MKNVKKERLDVLLVEKGLVASRERAKSSIMAGLVLVDGQRIDKAGTTVPVESNIVVTGDNIGYVSRGGLKLAKALKHFEFDMTGYSDRFTVILNNGPDPVITIMVNADTLNLMLKTRKLLVKCL